MGSLQEENSADMFIPLVQTNSIVDGQCVQQESLYCFENSQSCYVCQQEDHIEEECPMFNSLGSLQQTSVKKFNQQMAY